MSHLRKELLQWKAEGRRMSNVNEKHLEQCGACQSEVESAEKELAIAKMPPLKPRINKMGRSHRGYIKAIS